MKGFVRIAILMLLVASLLSLACKRKHANIPHVNDIISNMHYLDSLVIISENVNQFLRLCAETPNNLEIMEQEVREAHSQFLGGKTDIATYVSNLLQYDQLLVDINIRLSEQIASMRTYLSIQAKLIPQLNPLPNNE